MARHLAFAVLVFSVAAAGVTQPAGAKGKEKDFTFKGKFTKDDPKDQQRGGPAQTHVVPMKAGGTGGDSVWASGSKAPRPHTSLREATGRCTSHHIS